ncbi:MAG: patatin-like phospholipase family protein [Urechidicola sp.]|nr:patatin-like phospholipase family protein [Urechidicola sp.]
MEKFTQNSDVLKIIKRAEQLKKDNHRFSDIEDAHGNQYVDLVQEGGGVLGIALVGYTYVLENAGIRFCSLAGTSAGAINTMMMAGLGKIEEKKSEKILKLISEQAFFDFVDGESVVKRMIDKIVKGEKGIVRFLLWKLRGFKIFKILKRKLGLNPGTVFQNWIDTSLQDVGINSMKDLLQLRTHTPNSLVNAQLNEPITNLVPKLAIITSDITTHTKTEFPRMSALYWSDPNSVAPSELVRASMSIPFFFEPYEVGNIPNAETENDVLWYEYARYSGPVPKSVKFVDGGMLSNFPINVFHRPDGGVPRMPTFGARLSVYRETYSKADKLLGISGAMVSTMRQIHDYDFLLKNPDYSRLICRIDADEEFNWLDFNMTSEKQVKLFLLGAEKAIKFLEGFDWEAYKILRAKN